MKKANQQIFSTIKNLTYDSINQLRKPSSKIQTSPAAPIELFDGENHGQIQSIVLSYAQKHPDLAYDLAAKIIHQCTIMRNQDPDNHPYPEQVVESRQNADKLYMIMSDVQMQIHNDGLLLHDDHTRHYDHYLDKHHSDDNHDEIRDIHSAEAISHCNNIVDSHAAQNEFESEIAENLRSEPAFDQDLPLDQISIN